MPDAQLALPIDAPAKVWNPRYVAYARAHGRGPDDMLAYDRERYPGACMMEFSLWIGERWTAFRAARGLRRDGYGEDRDFDGWLERSGEAGELDAGLRELRGTVSERVAEWTCWAENPKDPEEWRTACARRDEATAILEQIDRRIEGGS